MWPMSSTGYFRVNSARKSVSGRAVRVAIVCKSRSRAQHRVRHRRQLHAREILDRSHRYRQASAVLQGHELRIAILVQADRNAVDPQMNRARRSALDLDAGEVIELRL